MYRLVINKLYNNKNYFIEISSGKSADHRIQLPKEKEKEKEPDHKNSSEPWQEWFDLSKMEWYYGAIDRQEAGALFSKKFRSFLSRKIAI